MKTETAEVVVVCRTRFGSMREVSRKTFTARLTPKRYALPARAVGWANGTAYFYRGGPRSGKLIDSTDVYSSYVFTVEETTHGPQK